ncbi:hypothetical protein ATO8_15873 [Roseivivax marinus]|uniref:Uncharacterized protein n=1 Tax=Roseivivax marinus TaxID=1379903 RepID=W4HIA3_9RHOB|nr:hypothetical protein [Roseivivax marinus]ETW11740.1 hypothetical protein ATO8_15873 [Roseivivax marinus]
MTTRFETDIDSELRARLDALGHDLATLQPHVRNAALARVCRVAGAVSPLRPVGAARAGDDGDESAFDNVPV